MESLGRRTRAFEADGRAVRAVDHCLIGTMEQRVKGLQMEYREEDWPVERRIVLPREVDLIEVPVAFTVRRKHQSDVMKLDGEQFISILAKTGEKYDTADLDASNVPGVKAIQESRCWDDGRYDVTERITRVYVSRDACPVRILLHRMSRYLSSFSHSDMIQRAAILVSED